jgi:hypothetical protein
MFPICSILRHNPAISAKLFYHNGWCLTTKVYYPELQVLLHKNPTLSGIFVAEGEGFEPSKGFDSFTGLANQRTRPLCDPSISPI